MLTINIQKCKHLLLDKTGKSTTAALSKASGISIPTLDLYAAGNAFTSTKADVLAAALGVSVFDILTDVEERGE